MARPGSAHASLAFRWERYSLLKMWRGRPCISFPMSRRALRASSTLWMAVLSRRPNITCQCDVLRVLARRPSSVRLVGEAPLHLFNGGPPYLVSPPVAENRKKDTRALVRECADSRTYV